MSESEIARLTTALQEARETNKRLNRRCNEYEGALREKLKTAEELAGSRTFGRILANSAANVFADDSDALREVLAFYADPHNYGEPDYGELPPVIADQGARARDALEPDAWQRWRERRGFDTPATADASP